MSTVRIFHAAMGIWFLACSSISSDGTQWVDTSEEGVAAPEASGGAAELGVKKQALTGTNKICSVFDGGLFRDTIVVPDNWGLSNCSAFAALVNVPSMQLGCLSDTSFVFGRAGAASGGGVVAPSPNCGW